MSKAIFAGSFDPPTYGHLNIIERSSRMFDFVDVVVAINPNKKYLFSDEERLAMLKQLVAPYVNVTVNPCDCLIVDYAREHGANVLLRGIRNTNDFSYEFDLAMMNRSLSHQIETLFIPTEQRFVVLKSSAIKELAMFGGDISGMVPPIVAQALYSKFPNARKK